MAILAWNISSLFIKVMQDIKSVVFLHSQLSWSLLQIPLQKFEYEYE